MLLLAQALPFGLTIKRLKRYRLLRKVMAGGAERDDIAKRHEHATLADDSQVQFLFVCSVHSDKSGHGKDDKNEVPWCSVGSQLCVSSSSCIMTRWLPLFSVHITSMHSVHFFTFRCMQTIEGRKRLRDKRSQLKHLSLGAAVALSQAVARRGAPEDSCDVAVRELLESTQIEVCSLCLCDLHNFICVDTSRPSLGVDGGVRGPGKVTLVTNAACPSKAQGWLRRNTLPSDDVV